MLIYWSKVKSSYYDFRFCSFTGAQYCNIGIHGQVIGFLSRTHESEVTWIAQESNIPVISMYKAEDIWTKALWQAIPLLIIISTFCSDRQKDLEMFLDHTRAKFVGFQVRTDHSSLAGLPHPIHEGVKVLKQVSHVSHCHTYCTNISSQPPLFLCCIFKAALSYQRVCSPSVQACSFI